MKYPCVFRGKFIRTVDDHVALRWRDARGQEAVPFGALRKMWRERHCAELNPYGSEDCPYTEVDCALSFLTAVERSVYKDKPRGYFRSVARTMAQDRADNKPLIRDTIGTDVRDEPGLRSGAGEGRGLHRPLARPSPIGQVLGTFDLRPRQPQIDEGEKSPQ